MCLFPGNTHSNYRVNTAERMARSVATPSHRHRHREYNMWLAREHGNAALNAKNTRLSLPLLQLFFFSSFPPPRRVTVPVASARNQSIAKGLCVCICVCSLARSDAHPRRKRAYVVLFAGHAGGLYGSCKCAGGNARLLTGCGRFDLVCQM
ncbi:hypothetical protein B0T16DRAFT_60053 [Cercophora newfieldiana]|uniref:Uncharacterized protein n=1 Tax=Cercophora newfieldiana TaxID=92897 RepID=A0AA39YRQ0_9PEZI|nr:hypothetical protein B0T16DRAFT_60053 [Cercophora newfieldiana]